MTDEAKSADDVKPMPRYQSHKIVQALECEARQVPTPDPGTCVELVPVDTDFEPFKPNQRWVDKHEPAGRGYFVVYPDGYTSWSPAAAFEEGYTLVDGNAPKKKGGKKGGDK